MKTIPAFARLIGIKAATLRKAVEEGRLPATRDEGSVIWLINPEDEQVKAYVAEFKAKPRK